jgi:tRNA threonylcarbamoyladenosine biosynthesis protein TsaE
MTDKDSIIYSINDVESVAEQTLENWELLKIITLSGQVGAGKTTLAKALIHKLTQTPTHSITSPTYTYLNTYHHKNLVIHHFDLYRLDSFDKFSSLGLLDEIEQGSLSIIEWPGILKPIIQDFNTLNLRIHHENQNERRLQLNSLVGSCAL